MATALKVARLDWEQTDLEWSYKQEFCWYFKACIGAWTMTRPVTNYIRKKADGPLDLPSSCSLLWTMQCHAGTSRGWLMLVTSHFFSSGEEPTANTEAAECLCDFFGPTKDLSYKYFSVLFRYLHATGSKKAELQCLLVLGCWTMPAASTDRA